MICPVVEWIFLDSSANATQYYMDKEGAGVVSEGTNSIWIEERFSKEGKEKEIKDIMNAKTDALTVIDYDTIKKLKSARMFYHIDYTDKTKVEFILKFISYHDEEGNTLYSHSLDELKFLPQNIKDKLFDIVLEDFNLE